jgi:hypothetical protein
MLLRIALLAIALDTCGSPAKPLPVPPAQQSEAPGDATTPTPESGTPIADGEPCLRADQCASGICEGGGCTDDAPGSCVPKDRMCTRDARSYCGCDGKTFVGSGSCPGQRYQAREACAGDPGPLGPKP